MSWITQSWPPLEVLIDQNLPVALIDTLAGLGHEALHVKRLGLTGADDIAIWRRAQALECIVIGKDKDFVALAQRDPGGTGLIHLKLGNCSNSRLYELVRYAWPRIILRLRDGASVVEVGA